MPWLLGLTLLSLIITLYKYMFYFQTFVSELKYRTEGKMDEPDKKTKSSLLEDLICRLPLANAVPKKSAGERSRPCEFCPFQG